MSDQQAENNQQGPDAFVAIALGIIIGAALIAAMALYYPVRGMGFYHDDRVTILQNKKIQSPSLAVVLSENPFRAVVNITFAIQHRLHSPDLPRSPLSLSSARPLISKQYTSDGRIYAAYNNPADGQPVPVSIDRERGLVFPLPPALPFRALNLAVHIINAFILFFVLGRITQSPLLSAVACTAFLLHPLTTETVNYITARFALFAATFSLLALHFHLSSDDKPAREAAAVVCFILALFSKETAVVLPLIIFLLDLARGRLRTRVLFWLILSGIYLILRTQWLIVLGGREEDILSWYQYLLIQQRVFWIYLAKIVLPIHQSFDYHIVPGLLLDIPFAVINAAALCACGYVLVMRLLSLRSISGTGKGSSQKAEKLQASGKKKGSKEKRAAKDAKKPSAKGKKPLAPANIAVWICAILVMNWITLAPNSSVIPLGDIAKDDRVYFLLAIIIPALLAVVLANLPVRPGTAFRAPTIACIVLVLLLLLPLTLNRNRVWSSELTLNHDTIMKSPQKPRAVYNYATALKWLDQTQKALHWYEMSLKLDPDNPNAITNVRVLRQLVEKEKEEGP